MRPTVRLLLVLSMLVLGVGFAAGCSSDDEDGEGEPTVPASTREPEDQARPTATPKEDDNGGTDGEAPLFEDGEWTGGEATVTVSGADTRTVSGTLLSDSATDGQTTRLIFAMDIDTINISISRQYLAFDISVYQEGFSATIPLEAEPCEVTYAEASETRIEATFRCDGEIELGESEGPVVLEGSFTATR